MVSREFLVICMSFSLLVGARPATASSVSTSAAG
jgi:hypothetical protein